jgi:hypothetical protein
LALIALPWLLTSISSAFLGHLLNLTRHNLAAIARVRTETHHVKFRLLLKTGPGLVFCSCPLVLLAAAFLMGFLHLVHSPTLMLNQAAAVRASFRPLAGFFLNLAFDGSQLRFQRNNIFVSLQGVAVDVAALSIDTLTL